MNRTLKYLLVGALAVVLVGAVAVVGVNLWLDSDDAPDAFAASDASDVSEAPAERRTDPESPDLDGVWQIEILDDSEAGVGYRVVEDVPIGGPEEVVARTDDVEGSMQLQAGAVTEVQLSMEVDTLRSDNQLRDDVVAADYLESSSFPTATLVLTEPTGLELPSTDGVTAPFEVDADLTIHGVTRAVRVVGEGQTLGEAIEIVGTSDITLSEVEVDRPSLLGRSARDDASVEFKLRFVRSSPEPEG